VRTDGAPAPAHPRTRAPLPLILSVGRLVEKKGFPDLIAACAQLRQSGRRFRCAIYGGGPLHDDLATLIEQLNLADCVTLAGECSQTELIPIFQRAAIFALASFVTDDNDRDGIPNVLVEAMACGLPVVSTAVAGIPELVRHGDNGLMVASHDVPALADALATLLDDQPSREHMGIAARATVVEHFDLRAAARQIATLFDQAPTKLGAV
jgi:glycosyltransferase involved in cell wall biosynthesis